MPGHFATVQGSDLTHRRSLALAWIVAGAAGIDVFLSAAAHADPPDIADATAVETPTMKAPLALQLQADRQYYDAASDLVVATGNVSARINGGLLQADRLEFDTSFNTLAARGSVRFRRGAQYFQAGSLRFSLIHNEGVMEDVYGVLDLDSAALDLNPTRPVSGQSLRDSSQRLPTQESSNLGFPTAQQIELESSTAGRISVQPEAGTIWDQPNPSRADWMVPADVRAESSQHLDMACPPLLPPVPDWHPHPWAATVWGGQSIDSNFGDTFLFNGRMRPEYLGGLTLQKRIWKAGPLALELEGNLFAHQAYSQAGGEFNQAVPFADTPSQTFGEGILGIGARVWLQPWLSLGVVEGVSYFTTTSNYERTYRENYAQLLNYLGIEVEAAISQRLSLVGRIHHRSGAFGTYSGVREGSNAYLIGARYRWGQDQAPQAQTDVPPPLGCSDPDRATRVARKTLNEELEAIAFDPPSLDLAQASAQPDSLPSTQTSTLSLTEQEQLRADAISRIDQRISSIQFQQALKFERRQGVPKGVNNSNIEKDNEYGGIRAVASSGKVKLIEGVISRWRIQAANVKLTPEGWTAERMGFTNDPFTPAQTRLDAENVVATQDSNGDILISAERNRLVVEERFSVNVSRTQRIQKEEEVTNRWVFGLDNDDRDGFFIGREMKSIELGDNLELSLQPQVLVQRAIDGQTNSYIEPGSAIDSEEVEQPVDIADLFGLEAELKGTIWGFEAEANADISTLSPQNFANGSRFWGELAKTIQLPVIGNTKANIFGAYRYRTWNGSLGETDVYSALGGYLQRTGTFKIGNINNSFLWRTGIGSYQAKSFTSDNLTELWRANAYGSLNSSYSIWRGQTAALTPQAAYRYSPVAIVPGLSIRTNLNSALTAFGDGSRQGTVSLSGGPSLTLGTFSKPFLDYTSISLSGGGTLRYGASPFAFDQAIDLGTVGVSVTQQLAGPLVLSAAAAFNVDPNSDFYGNVINSNIELRWQRRSYDFGFYYNPYEGIGGFRFRLNDFNFTGTGVPFIPYTPRNLPNNLDERPF